MPSSRARFSEDVVKSTATVCRDSYILLRGGEGTVGVRPEAITLSQRGERASAALSATSLIWGRSMR